MRPETLALLGGVLIVASASLAILAYILWRRRQEEEGETGEGQPSETALEPEPKPDRVPAGAEATAPRRAEAPPRIPTGPPPTPATEAAALPAGEGPAASRLIPVATLLRDEVTGGLVIRVGERDYRSAGEVLVSGDRRRLEYTLADLNRWFGVSPGAEAPRAKVDEEKTVKALPRKLSMVEQINQIVEHRLAEEPGGRRGVRLVEGTGGSVRVYLGVEGYDSIEAVPDPEVRRIIREAVSEWENAQG